MRKISAKKLKALGGKMPFSTIASPRKALRKSKRKPSETLRIYGPKGFVEWIHEQPCAACGVVGYSECAHIRTGGTGRKDDWTQTVPLCGSPMQNKVGCHEQLHHEGRVWFESMRDIDLDQRAADTHRAWLSIKGRLP